GQYDEAIAAYREALRLKPDHATACSNLAGLLANAPDPKLRNPAEAVRLGCKAVKLLPHDAKAWQLLGWAHYRNGAWKDSIESLNKSITLQENPKGGSSRQWFGLALAHWKLGNPAEARKWYDRAVAWMEKNAPADKELRRFRTEAAELMKIKEGTKPK